MREETARRIFNACGGAASIVTFKSASGRSPRSLSVWDILAPADWVAASEWPVLLTDQRTAVLESEEADISIRLIEALGGGFGAASNADSVSR